MPSSCPPVLPAARFETVEIKEPFAPEVFGELRAALVAYEQQPGSAETRQRVGEARRALALRVLVLPKRDKEAALVGKSLRVVRELAAAGIQDYAVASEDRALLSGRLRREWPAAIAGMLLGAAWQWGDAAPLSTLPPWLWGEYSAWLFAAPMGFTAPEDAERYAAHTLRFAGEVGRLLERNLGSAAVRAAAEAYLHNASGIPLYFSRGDLRRHAEIRGRILKRLLGHEAVPFDPMPYPRAGRRLKIGFLNRHFGPQTETYTTLPTFEQLDPDRFEVILFSLRDADTPLAEHARSRVSEFRVLPADFDGQMAILRDANLDVLVFGTNVTAAVHEVTRLALHRIAPLQVVNNSSCTTTGFPDVDLYVSGELTETAGAAGHFSERLGLLPGPAHAFNYEPDQQEPAGSWTRAALGIPEDAVVFVSAANYFKIIPEMQDVWAKLLAAVPRSRLLVHPFNPNWTSTYPITRFCAEFDRVLAAHGVAGDRLVVSTAKFPSRADVRDLLAVGDVYLDTFPFGGVNSLVDPLEAGVPVVAWEGVTFRSRMGAALLRALGLTELIVSSEAGYLEVVRGLALDPARRTSIRERIRSAMAQTPAFLDPLAASDAFGDLIEAAFDELLARGRADFRADGTPLRVSGAAHVEETLQAGALSLEVGATASAAGQARAVLRGVPNHGRARLMLGRAYLAAGEPRRAVDYLFGALPQMESEAGVWFDLARALRESGRTPQALQALEAALRLDPTRLDPWLLLFELAQAIGADEIARDALAAAQQLDQQDPRVQAAIARA
jgi:protein O-GlcNAc transferase